MGLETLGYARQMFYHSEASSDPALVLEFLRHGVAYVDHASLEHTIFLPQPATLELGSQVYATLSGRTMV